ncbi:allophanate hydrolase-related protein [Lichenicola cladoniae]|uniref:allophanate hydrolase-related protein n=1 Tax=Lichenicola cladoniae TaxID=1484109 RepID=UPI001EF55525|nr:amidase family protein [Lichenicola cladoniae]
MPEKAFHFGVLSGADRDFDADKEAEALYDAAIANLACLGGTPVPIDYTPFRDVAALLYDGPYVAERLAAIEPFITWQPEAMDPVVHRIIADAARFSAVDAFKAQYRLLSLARQAALQWTGIDMLLLPTTPTIFKLADIASDPVRLNGLLGLYTNFVNLLDDAAIAIPAGFRSNGLPFGVTLIGPAFSDSSLARLGAPLHRAAGCGAGLDRSVGIPLPEPDMAPLPGIVFALAGAHLSGMSLNSELITFGAELVGEARTAADYRLVLLDAVPRKPGLVQTPGFDGQGIELELWRLSDEGFGRFVASLPQPMSMGKVALADGRIVSGFSCEPSAVTNSVDITKFGGWRRYISEATGA